MMTSCGITLPEPAKVDTTNMTPLQRLKDHRLVYLASPYSAYPAGLDTAANVVAFIAGHLIEKGVIVYSPIANTHAIAKAYGLDPLNHDLWLPFDEVLMNMCDALCIALMKGWQASKGVRYEIERFRGVRWSPGSPPISGKPVYYIDPVSLEVF
jgi:hypothetical protein